MLLAAVQKMLRVVLFILPIVVHVFPPYGTKNGYSLLYGLYKIRERATALPRILMVLQSSSL